MRRDVDWSTLRRSALAVAVVVGVAATLYVAGDAFAADAAHGDGHGGLGLTPEKLKDLGWRAMNFAALVIILVKFLKKPIVDGLRGRRQSIREEFDDLESQRSSAEAEYQQYASRLSGLDDELKKMVETAIAQGELEKERIITEANEAAEQIKRQAEMAVANAVAEAKVNLKLEVAEQASSMAEEIIKRNLQPEDQTALVEGYLAKVGGAA